MKPKWKRRLLLWICETFGHAKSDRRNAEWSYNGYRHYPCRRCDCIASVKERTNQ
jgi:hypothetical protein